MIYEKRHLTFGAKICNKSIDVFNQMTISHANTLYFRDEIYGVSAHQAHRVSRSYCTYFLFVVCYYLENYKENMTKTVRWDTL